MPTVTMRELKQNPQAVVSHVLTTNEPFHITSHGHETGVVVQPVQTQVIPRRFLPGSVLNEIFATTPLSPEQAQSWKDDIAAAIDDDVIDPWES